MNHSEIRTKIQNAAILVGALAIIATVAVIKYRLVFPGEPLWKIIFSH